MVLVPHVCAGVALLWASVWASVLPASAASQSSCSDILPPARGSKRRLVTSDEGLRNGLQPNSKGVSHEYDFEGLCY